MGRSPSKSSHLKTQWSNRETDVDVVSAVHVLRRRLHIGLLGVSDAGIVCLSCIAHLSNNSEGNTDIALLRLLVPWCTHGPREATAGESLAHRGASFNNGL